MEVIRNFPCRIIQLLLINVNHHKNIHQLINKNMKINKKYIRKITSFLSIFMIVIFLISCNESPTDIALKWSTDIKSKIFEDIKSPVDSVSVDSSRQNYKEISLYSNGIRTKLYGISFPSGDTIISIYFSKDQNFEIVRELCPGMERNFEGIRYKGEHLGLAEFTYCDGKLKEQGYRYEGDVGIWKEWDEQGNLIYIYDYGNVDKLKNLKKIKYYR